jgi:transcriptional regulator with XRE-family HTH domain
LVIDWAMSENHADAHPMRKWRKDHDLTLDDVGQRLGRTAATVSRWENGTRKPRHNDLQKIEEVLGIPIAEVVNAAVKQPEIAK